jgi:hypothetical protein
MVAMCVRLVSESCFTQINVIFVIDPGAPYSYLTKEVVSELYESCPKASNYLRYREQLDV